MDRTNVTLSVKLRRALRNPPYLIIPTKTEIKVMLETVRGEKSY